jgi:DNA-binding NarL/FixJ family response regulator
LKLLVVDDHALVRQGLKQVLQLLEPGQELQCLEAADGDQAMHMARLHPDLDLVLMDFDMPGKNGLSILADLGRHFPQIPVMMLSGMPNPALVQQAMNLGASGFLTKSGNSNELLHAIRHVLAGNLYLPSDLAAATGAEAGGPTQHAPVLTARQQAVLELLVQGMSNRQIGEHLHLSEETIKTHVSVILRELGVQSRVQAVSRARLWGYVV